MNILIVKLSAIGDVIHTLPALNAIRKNYPTAHITWLIEEAAAPLIEGHASLDRILISKRKRWINELKGKHRYRSIREISGFIKALRDTRYDIILDFQALMKSGILIALAKSNRKIGFDKGMDHMEHSYIFLNERIKPVSMEIHALTRYLMLLQSIGIPCHEIEYKIPINDMERKTADDLLSDHGINFSGKQESKPLIAINPVAKWETKLWKNKKFAELADRLIEEYNAGIIFTGGNEDQQIINEIISEMKKNAVNLAGKTSLKTLAAIYEKINFLITTDTGPMHLAAAIGTPVVALFGPTAPWRTGPYGHGHQIIRANIECSPCYKRRCPTMKCMESILVDDVMSRIKRFKI